MEWMEKVVRRDGGRWRQLSEQEKVVEVERLEGQAAVAVEDL